MLYYLFQYLDRINFPGAGVFTYVTFRAAVAIILALIVSVWFGNSFIKFLKRKKIVEAEDKAHPLSDDALCERLKQMGYKLERRTVAKYREALKIPSSTVRRKMAK